MLIFSCPFHTFYTLQYGCASTSIMNYDRCMPWVQPEENRQEQSNDGQSSFTISRSAAIRPGARVRNDIWLSTRGWLSPAGLSANATVISTDASELRECATTGLHAGREE